MMAKDIDRVCEKYELKLRTGKMPGRGDGDRERQVESYRRCAERNEALRSAVAAVLSRVGVCTIWWTSYYDFARKAARQVVRIGSPDVLRLEARMQLEVWVSRGLDRAVLEAIGREVFELDLTGPIQPLDGSAGPT
jgi:hypothetical protein